MALQLLPALVLSSVLGVFAAPSPPPSYNEFNWADIKHLITFGDSYTYVQGTHGLQNFSFIHDSLHLPFTPEELLSNQIVQNQTSTAEGGPNWVEYLTGCGLEPGLTSPRDCDIQLWDFAFGGADVSTKFTPLHHNFTTSLVNQTVQFEKYGDPVLSGFIDKAKTLVGVWIGINDINDSAEYDVDFPSFYDKLVATVFKRVRHIYKLGYSNFLVINLPPLDRTPGNVVRSGGPLPNKTMIDWYDGALQDHSATFQKKYKGSKVMYFDANTFLNGVLDRPSEYGIKNSTGYCAAYDQTFINTDPGMYGCLPLDEYLSVFLCWSRRTLLIDLCALAGSTRDT